MEELILVRVLAALTGHLVPVDGSSEADLHEARVRLARYLATTGITGTVPPLDEDVPESVLDVLRLIAEEVLQAIPTPTLGAVVPLVVRTAIDEVGRDVRINGREVVRALGPFADSVGLRYWFEVVEPVAFTRCVRAPGVPLLLAQIGGAGTGPATDFTLGRGTLWLRAALLGGPRTAWTGLRIDSGTLRLSAPGTLANGVLQVPDDTECVVQIVLDPPSAPPPSPIGEDGQRTRAGRPDRAEIRIPANGVGRVVIGATFLEVYGARLEFEAADTPGELDRQVAPSALLIPVRPRDDQFQPVDVRSNVLSIGGETRVERAFWALPLTLPADLRELGQAADVGDMVVVAGAGLRLSWPGVPDAGYRAARVVLAAGSAMLGVHAAQAPGRQVAQPFRTWSGSTGGRSHVHLRYGAPAPLHHVCGVRASAPRELTLVFGAGEATLNPPVYADGESLAFAEGAMSALFVRTPGSRFVLLRGGNDTGTQQAATMALVNALLGVTRPFDLTVSGMLAAEHEIVPAIAVLRAGVSWIWPTLPDPYAANFDLSALRRAEQHGIVTVRVDWEPPELPRVRFALAPVEGQTAGRLFPPGRAAERDRQSDRLRAIFDDERYGPRLPSLVLLDVSTNADQLGVATAFPERAIGGRSPVTLERLELCAQADFLQVLTVPLIQWETVWNEPNPLTAPFPPVLPSTGDGGPALFRGDSVSLVPLAPLPLSAEIVAAHNERGGDFSALFTLPFGICAATRIGPPDSSGGQQNRIRWIAPRFADLVGARQLSITSGNGRSLPGAALQTFNGIDGMGVARNILEPDIDDFFTNRFGPGAPQTAEVPVSRIDVSGYGASCFSRWSNPAPAVVDVTKVQFDVLVGRTAHEVVQVQTLLWPSQAVVVRSVTMQRRGNGRVIRRDSGWQAATPGRFRHPLSQCEFHTGVVQGYFNIREIRDTSQRVTVTDPVTQAVAELVAVYFDCDVAVEHAVRGHRTAVIDGQSLLLVGSQRQLGFVQVWPEGAPPPGPLTPGQLAALFTLQGAIGGRIDCEIDIGGSGQRMRLEGVHANVAPAPSGPPQFAVEADGSLRLPSAGQWSAVRVPQPIGPVDSPEVEALDPDRGLPLVRPNGMGASYRFADPRDLLRSAPHVEYALLFASPAHRLLFREPRIEPGAQALTSLKAPLLADSYGMSSSRGLFPRFHDAIPLPSSSYSLDVIGEAHLRLRPRPLSFAYTGTREISNSGNLRLFVEYANTPFSLTFDSTAQDQTWSYDCGRPALVAEDAKLGRVAQALTLQEGREKTGLMSMEPELKFGAALDSASKLITVLRKFGFPVRVRVHLTDTDLLIEVKVSTERDVKPRPGSPPSFKKRVDLGIGKYSGEIKLVIRSGSPLGKSGLELEVKGEIQQETPIPKVYAGGFIEVQMKFERDHRKQESETRISLAAGCVASIGGEDLIPKLLKAEITVRRGYIFQVQPDAPDPANRVSLGLMMGLEVGAAVKVPTLGDVIRVEFEWEGRALIQRLEFDGVLDSKVWIRAIVKAALSVSVLFIDGEFELETEYQEHVPMVAVAGLAAAFGLGLLPPP